MNFEIMDKQPLVSIIVPIYKVPERFLRQCIESCINQTLREIEIILVDDGSPDTCGKICDEYANKDLRVKVIHKENGGLVSARNAGFDIVKGEWHMYLDGDDWIDENTCEKLLENIKDFPDVNIVFWNCIQELGDNSIKGKWEWHCDESRKLYKDSECQELSRNVLIYKSGIATAYSKLINTDYARQYGIKHDNRLRQGMEGTEFSLRVFYHAKKALFIKEYFNHYRYNDTSISKRIDEKNTQCLMDCMNVMAEDVAKMSHGKSFENALYQRIVYALIAVAMNTYFHPNILDNVWTAARKFANIINQNDICRKAISYTSLTELDTQRRIALLFMKVRLYILLKPIAIAKQKLLKRGYYNY